VRILGPRGDVGDLLGASDIMLLASRTEGMPGCLIEAGMAGLPSVAFDVAGVTEVLSHGRSGFVLPLDDVEGMRQALHALASDASRRVSMGDEARRRCERFDIAHVARRFEDVYRQIGGREAA
jgi:glycosyltransferase involved in cell wall biosynthesis